MAKKIYKELTDVRALKIQSELIKSQRKKENLIKQILNFKIYKNG